jgi:hypothetical protein
VELLEVEEFLVVVELLVEVGFLEVVEFCDILSCPCCPQQHKFQW